MFDYLIFELFFALNVYMKTDSRKFIQCYFLQCADNIYMTDLQITRPQLRRNRIK